MVSKRSVSGRLFSGWTLILIIGWKPTMRLWESLPPPFVEALGTEQRSKYSRQFPWQWNGRQAWWTRASWWCVNEGEEQASLEDLQSNRIVNCRRMVWEHRTRSFGPVCVTAFERMLLFYILLTSFYCLCCVSACPFKEFKAMH